MSRCPYPECKANVPSNHFACTRHWFMVPKYIRGEIWAAYRDGIKRGRHPNARWRKVAHEAIEYLRHKHAQGPVQSKPKPPTPKPQTPKPQADLWPPEGKDTNG